MRVRKSVVLLLATATAFLVAGAYRYQHQLGVMVASLWRESPPSDMLASQAYEITEDWVAFPVIRDADVLRILTNAGLHRPLPEMDYAVPRIGWNYAIDWQLLDDFGKQMDQGRVHLRTMVNEYNDSEGRRAWKSRFDDPSVIPAGSRQFYLPLEKLSGRPAQVRVRLASADAGIGRMVARVLAHVERDHYDDPMLWQQISRRRKERLCRAEIYPPDLLSPEQRTNLLRWMWIPSAPIDTSGRALGASVLYSFEAPPGIEVRPPSEPNALTLMPGGRRVVRFPDVPGTFRLAANARHGHNDHDGNSEVRVQVFDEAGHQLQDFRVDGADHLVNRGPSPAPFIVQQVRGGWAEVSSSMSWELSPTWISAGSDCEQVVGEASQVRTYKCEAESIAYEIHHVPGLPTGIRLRVRAAIRSGDAVDSCASVRWRFESADATVLEEGALSVPGVTSEFDAPRVRDPALRVSEPVTRFFMLPPTVHRIILTADGGSPLVDLANRPSGLPARRVARAPSVDEVVVPERSWFPIRPVERHNLEQADRVVDVWQAARPPVPQEPLIEGNYDWQDFRPAGPWTGRQVLVPRGRSDQPVRQQARATTFFEIPIASTCLIQLLHQDADQAVSVVASAREGSAKVAVSGVTVPRVEMQLVSGGSQCRELRGVQPGLCRLHTHATAKGVRLFVNHIDMPGESRFLRRTVVRHQGASPGEDPTRFHVTKASPDEELLVLDVYDTSADVGQISDTQVRVDVVRGSRRAGTPVGVGLAAVESLKPFDAFPESAWEFTLHSADVEDVLLLGTAKRLRSHRCFLRLGAHIPPGDVEVVVNVRSPRTTYLHLSRLLRGDFPSRQFRRELAVKRKGPATTVGSHSTLRNQSSTASL